MTKVLIVEDQRMAREYMEDYVNRDGRYQIVGSITNAAMAELFCAVHPVDLILMDVCTEHDESGLEAAAVIKKHYPQIKIIIVTSMVECGFLEEARRAGAESFWYKDVGREQLLEVMERTMQGESIYPEKTPEVQVGLAKSGEFTEGEIRVLRLLAEGMSYDEIAEAIGVKSTTVRYHVGNMLMKTGFSNKTQLAIAATSKKMILPKRNRDLEN